MGLGTHILEVIEYAEEEGWDVGFYMASLYNISRRRRQSALVNSILGSNWEEFFHEDPPLMCQTIRQTSKTCLAFKILAAGCLCQSQEDVHRALEFAFSNIKPQDAVVVGMFTKYQEQITLNVQHVKEILKEATYEGDNCKGI